MTIVRPGDGSGWETIRTAGEASVAITSSQPRSGHGSLEFVQDGASALADVGLFWTDPGRTLGHLSEVAFEWRRADDGTAPDVLAPALRLHYDADADVSTEDDRGALIWEWKYNGEGAAPVEAWQQADVTDDAFWMFKHQPGEAILEHDVTLAAWAAGPEGLDPGFAPDLLSEASLITGIELASGNGWPGSFQGFVDNLKVAFGDDLILANFEPPVTSPFTTESDRIDLNELDLAAYDQVTRALAGDDVVRLSETQYVGSRFAAGEGNDRIHGSLQDDLIDGGAGDDHLIGRDGIDQLFGGPGDDRLRGGRGYDDLFGGAGDDELIGNQGHDLLDGGAGDDELIGGGSQDVFLISGRHFGDDRILDFRSGMDTIRLEAVLDLDGNDIQTFADADDHQDGRLDARDAGLSDDGEALTWHFEGGSLTVDGVLALTPADIVVA